MYVSATADAGVARLSWWQTGSAVSASPTDAAWTQINGLGPRDVAHARQRSGAARRLARSGANQWPTHATDR